MMLVSMVTVLLVLFSEILANESILDVRIEQGILRGKYETSYKGRQFSAFTSIPYAEPPVGDLRFKVLYIFKFSFMHANVNFFPERFEMIHFVFNSHLISKNI